MGHVSGRAMVGAKRPAAGGEGMAAPAAEDGARVSADRGEFSRHLPEQYFVKQRVHTGHIFQHRGHAQ